MAFEVLSEEAQCTYRGGLKSNLVCERDGCVSMDTGDSELDTHPSLYP